MAQKSSRTAGGVFGLICVHVLAVACGTADDGNRVGARHELGAPSSATFVDPFGRTWVRKSSKPVVYDTTDHDDELSIPVPIASKDKDLDIRNMSPEDVTAALRPISLIGDYEYTLNDVDAREFALAIQEVARGEKGTEGGLGARSLGEPAIDGPAQREPGTEQPVEMPEPKGIIGSDDRYSINGSRANFPWNNYAAMDAAGTCSAVKLVNHHTAVTAAHCVHTGSAWKTRKRITFVAGSPVGSTCYGMTVPGCWDGSTSSPSCDYATIKFREGSGFCDFNTYNVGYLGWQSAGSWVTGIWGHVSGYPSEQMKPGWVYPELVFHQRGDGYSTPTYPDRVFYLVDTSGGQSGGPFTSYYQGNDYRIRGVHKGFSIGVFEDTNQGRKMTQSLFNWFYANGGW
jgi:V8-like Glu-specific endopeptidase